MNIHEESLLQTEFWSLWLLSRLLKTVALILGLIAGLVTFGLFVSTTYLADLLESIRESTADIPAPAAIRLPRAYPHHRNNKEINL
ncbi:MAG: hypothetical protein ACRETO_09910 [Gammaproteobacteria bacterium]